MGKEERVATGARGGRGRRGRDYGGGGGDDEGIGCHGGESESLILTLGERMGVVGGGDEGTGWVPIATR